MYFELKGNAQIHKNGTHSFRECSKPLRSNRLKIGTVEMRVEISVLMPHYLVTRRHDDNDYLRLRYTGVRRALEFTAFSPRVVSADLHRFTARQDLAKLSPFPVFPP